MYTDPLADYLTRIRNANSAGHRVVSIPASNLKEEITKILFDQGYILSTTDTCVWVTARVHVERTVMLEKAF